MGLTVLLNASPELTRPVRTRFRCPHCRMVFIGEKIMMTYLLHQTRVHG